MKSAMQFKRTFERMIISRRKEELITKEEEYKNELSSKFSETIYTEAKDKYTEEKLLEEEQAKRDAEMRANIEANPDDAPITLTRGSMRARDLSEKVEANPFGAGGGGDGFTGIAQRGSGLTGQNSFLKSNDGPTVLSRGQNRMERDSDPSNPFNTRKAYGGGDQPRQGRGFGGFNSDNAFGSSTRVSLNP